MSEHGVVGTVRELLRPVDHHRFEEATTPQLEEGNQVPEHAQTAEAEKRVRKQQSEDHRQGPPPGTTDSGHRQGPPAPNRRVNSLVRILSEGDGLLEFPLLEGQGGPLSRGQAQEGDLRSHGGPKNQRRRCKNTGDLSGFQVEQRQTERKRHLVELHQQDGGRPAGVIEGQEEDAEQPRRAVHQGGDGAPQALLLVLQHAASGPV